MAYRVIQWATGGVGRAGIEGILSHPELDLVGVWVHSEDKNGRDAGELCGRDPIGVRATTDAEALLAMEADCVFYAPIMADKAEVIRILESGKNVVTTERDLKKLFPRDTWNRRHLQIIYFGREHCPALYHDLSGCPICSWAASKKRIAEEAAQDQARRKRR